MSKYSHSPEQLHIMPVYHNPNHTPRNIISTGSSHNLPRQDTSPLQDPTVQPTVKNWKHEKTAVLPKRGGGRQMSSRAELIESIKRGESPTWFPNPALRLLISRNNSLEDEDIPPQMPEEEMLPPENASNVHETEYECRPQKNRGSSPHWEIEPTEIERPRSALHTGDFFQKQSSPKPLEPQSRTHTTDISPSQNFLSSSPTTLWYTPPGPSLSSKPEESQTLWRPGPGDSRSRAPSLGSSFSSSFVFRPPTSPLVYAASNTDLDLPSTSFVRPSASPERSNRRRTLPPGSFHTLQSSLNGGRGPPNFSRPLLSSRRDSSLPCQAHQPRRSLTSTSMSQSASNPHTPQFARSRRPSLSSDYSPVQHACMVGSFEESILRGRMSMAPSKPLDFVAQIGVLGRGDCKPELRCPAHVTVPFPAVFYNYPSIGARSFSDDSPSPYVGTIDLERSLKPIKARKPRSQAASTAQSIDALVKDATAPENTRIGQAIDRRRRERQEKRSISPAGVVGGCYPVPQHGQLQIIIKNPNKTAVKLYLVPYSLEGMEAGTKTFVRQRSFSTGPMLEKPLARNPLSALSDTLEHKSILRYLIHLKFCCPSPGKYYLYDNIRVVFANRVPDGKENLRNEVQLPEPRYGPYRPSRERSMGRAGARLAAEKASRRRSSGFGLGSVGFDAMDGLIFTGPVASPPSVAPELPPSTAIPFHFGSRFDIFGRTNPALAEDEGTHPGTIMDSHMTSRPPQKPISGVGGPEPTVPGETATSPRTGFVPSTSTRASPIPWVASGFGANSCGSNSVSHSTASSTPAEPGEGLLTRELRSIEAQQSKNGSL